MYDSILEDILPNALMIGVDYDLFWRLNPKTLAPFHKAFSLRQQYDDADAWNLGNYIRIAIASNFAKNAKYPNRPNTYKEVIRVESSESIKEKFLRDMKHLNRRFKKE